MWRCSPATAAASADSRAAPQRDARSARQRWPGRHSRSTASMTAQGLGFDGPTRNSLDCGRRPRWRARIPRGRRRSARCTSRGSPRRSSSGCRPAFGFVTPARSLDDRLQHHAAEAQPGRGRAGARQGRAGFRLPGRAADHDEGPPAHLFQGHAGGQGTALRRGRHARNRSRRR